MQGRQKCMQIEDMYALDFGPDLTLTPSNVLKSGSSSPPEPAQAYCLTCFFNNIVAAEQEGFAEEPMCQCLSFRCC